MTRKERRDLYAERVCRELRWQIVNGWDADKLMKHFDMWMNNTGKIKYKRP